MADDIVRLGYDVDTAQIDAAAKRVEDLVKATQDLSVAVDLVSGTSGSMAGSIDSSTAAVQRHAAALDLVAGNLDKVKARQAAVSASSSATYDVGAGVGPANTYDVRKQGAYDVGARHGDLDAIISEMTRTRQATAAATHEVEHFHQVLASSSSVTAVTGKSLQKLVSGANAASYKLMIVGQTLDDLQYVGEQGLRPIINNLMQMSATVGIAAIGVNLLWTHWDQIAGLWGAGHTETETERMDRLGKATHKTASEQAEYNRLKKEAALIEASSGASKAQGKASAAISTAIKEFGEGNRTGDERLAQLLASERARKNPGGYLNPADQAKLDDVRNQELSPHRSALAQVKATASGRSLEQYFADQRRQIQEDARNNRMAEARAEIGNLGNPADRRRITAELRGYGQGGLADQLDAADPEAIKKKEREQEFDKVMAARHKEQADADQKQADDENALTAKRREDRAKAQEKAASEAAKALADPVEASLLANNARSDRDPRKKTGESMRVAQTKEIAARLEAAGSTAGEAAELAPMVFKEVFEGLAQKVRARALADGTGTATAAKAIQDERTRTLAEKQTREQEGFASKSTSEAKRQAPRIDKDIDTSLLIQTLAGKGATAAAEAVAKQVEAALKAKGLTDGEAKAAAAKLTEEGQARLESGLEHAGPDARPRKAPETIGAADFARAVQAAGGGDDVPKNQLEVQKQMLAMLGEQKRSLDRLRGLGGTFR